MKNSKNKEKLKENFRNQLLRQTDYLNSTISTNDGDWVVKGFIDVVRNIYTISVDTKVISKIMELLLFPKMCQFAQKNGYEIVLCKEQNHYPDITFIDNQKNKFAVDLKTTYRKTKNTVNGMTLGAFTGYFRERTKTKNITYPYDEYAGHFVLGIIYSRVDEKVDENMVYELDDLKNITSVIKDFNFFVQEKYRIAKDVPGSGNTKNIGSVSKINDLIKGNGPFYDLGEDIFDDYWQFYLTKDMAKAAELDKPPYKNLKEYKEYKSLKG